MITLLLGAGILALVTAVHEGGHWLAVRAKGGRVLRLQVGRGPSIWRSAKGRSQVVLALLPFGGRIDYEGVPSGTGQVVVAVSGAVANLLFAVSGFGLVRGLAATGSVPFGAGEGMLGYAVQSAGGWFWAIPGAVRELAVTGMAVELTRSIREAVGLLATFEPASVLYVASAASAVWAALNLVPVPVLNTDGWRAISALWTTVRRARREPPPPPS